MNVMLMREFERMQLRHLLPHSMGVERWQWHLMHPANRLGLAIVMENGDGRKAIETTLGFAAEGADAREEAALDAASRYLDEKISLGAAWKIVSGIDTEPMSLTRMIAFEAARAAICWRKFEITQDDGDLKEGAYWASKAMKSWVGESKKRWLALAAASPAS